MCYFITIWLQPRSNWFIWINLIDRVTSMFINKVKARDWSFYLLKWTTALSNGFLLLYEMSQSFKGMGPEQIIMHTHRRAKNSGNYHDAYANRRGINITCHPVLMHNISAHNNLDFVWKHSKNNKLNEVNNQLQNCAKKEPLYSPWRVWSVVLLTVLGHTVRVKTRLHDKFINTKL